MLLDSACEGWVIHRRTGPVQHRFGYPVWMLHVDVDRLGDIGSPFLSTTRRWAPLSLRAEDYPRDRDAAEGPGIRDAINARLQKHGYAPADRVFLLTQPRSWGWLFNPVSFYFCYRADALVNVLAEITNTPWDEVHTYVLDAAGRRDLVFGFPKQFHVSPFLPMDLDYRWRVKLQEDALEVVMRLTREGREVFFAGLYLDPRPLTSSALRWGAVRYPLQNVHTLARIYYQAFRLWRKGAPFHSHPRRQETEEVGSWR